MIDDTTNTPVQDTTPEIQPNSPQTDPVKQPESTPVESTTRESTNRDSSKEINLRILRERAEQAERRTYELERMVQMQQQQQQQRVEEPEPIDIDDDSFIEGKQLKKYVNSLKQELKSTKKQFEEYNQKSSFDQAELKLKSQFSDFDEIVNKDNLERLASRKPALYRSIMANGDIYDRGYTAYEMIRNSGVIEEKTSTHESAKIDKRLEENKLKPRSAASTPAQTGDSALTRVEDYDRRILSKERIELLRKHVEEAKRNR